MLVALGRDSGLEVPRVGSPHDRDRCGGLCSCSHLGEAVMGTACAFPLSVLLPGGHHSTWTCRDSQPLGSECKVWRGAMVRCKPTHSQCIPSCFEEQTPTAVYCQNNLDCPNRLPNPGPLNSSGLARTGFIFMVSSCLSCCRAPEQLADWSVSSLKEEG